MTTPPAESRLQFSLQDVLVALLCLLGPMAWIQSLRFAFEDDRGTAYIGMLIGWVCGFLLAINYRRAWHSQSVWYIPPFVFAGWSLALAPWALLTWAPLSLLFGITPAVFLGVTAYRYVQKMKNPWPWPWLWAFLGVFCGAAGSAILIPPLVTPRWAANQWTAASRARALVEAQEIYHRTDYDKDGVLEYAQSGWELYETKTGAADIALIDKASVQSDSTLGKPLGMKYGYYFKILQGQGAKAHGGAKSYIDASGNMTGGFAIVLYPAEYKTLGRDTFLFNQVGKIFSKDLGTNTQALVDQMTLFDPDTSWVPAE